MSFRLWYNNAGFYILAGLNIAATLVYLAALVALLVTISGS